MRVRKIFSRRMISTPLKSPLGKHGRIKKDEAPNSYKKVHPASFTSHMVPQLLIVNTELIFV